MSKGTRREEGRVGRGSGGHVEDVEYEHARKRQH